MAVNIALVDEVKKLAEVEREMESLLKRLGELFPDPEAAPEGGEGSLQLFSKSSMESDYASIDEVAAKLLALRHNLLKSLTRVHPDKLPEDGKELGSKITSSVNGIVEILDRLLERSSREAKGARAQNLTSFQRALHQLYGSVVSYRRYFKTMYYLGIGISYCYAPTLLIPFMGACAALDICNRFYQVYFAYNNNLIKTLYRSDFDKIRKHMFCESWMLAGVVYGAKTLYSHLLWAWYFVSASVPLVFIYAMDLPDELLKCFGIASSSSIERDGELSLASYSWVSYLMASLRTISLLAVYAFLPDFCDVVCYTSMVMSFYIIEHSNLVMDLLICSYAYIPIPTWITSSVFAIVAGVNICGLFCSDIHDIIYKLNDLSFQLREADKPITPATGGVTFEERVVNKAYSREMAAID